MTATMRCSADDDEPIGKRLLPQVVDRIARRNPDKVFTSTPETNDLEDGFYDVTYAEMARLVNFMSWWIHDHMGPSESFETLGYMGTTDFRYIVVFLAAIKCGYKLFVPSTRNSLNGNMILLHELRVVKFMHSVDIRARVDELKSHKENLLLYGIPSHAEMLAVSTKHFPYEKSYEEAELDDVFVCHTSGTTGKTATQIPYLHRLMLAGAPKPITVNNGHFSTYDNLRKMPEVPGRDNLDYSSLQMKDDGRFYSPFPPFHVGRVLIQPCTTLTPVDGRYADNRDNTYLLRNTCHRRAARQTTER